MAMVDGGEGNCERSKSRKKRVSRFSFEKI